MTKQDFVYIVTRILEFFYEYKIKIAKIKCQKYEAKGRFYDRMVYLVIRTREVFIERGVAYDPEH